MQKRLKTPCKRYTQEISSLTVKGMEKDQLAEQQSHKISLLEEEMKQLQLEGNKEGNKFLALFKEEVVELNEQLKEAQVNFFMELKGHPGLQ
jgi:hypothetical protein